MKAFDWLLLAIICLCIYGAVEPDGAEQMIRGAAHTAVAIWHS